MAEWTSLPQDKMLEFVSSIFKKDSITEEIMCAVLNSDEPLNTCIYRAIRGKNTICSNNAETPYGYCKKHSTTVQAKMAEQKWNELKEDLVSPQMSPEVSPQPSPEVSPEVSPQPSPEVSPQPSPKPKRNTITARRNEWGNYEHPATGFVFDIKTSQVYGVQHKDGNVYSLSQKDIKTCLLNGFEYVLPQVKYAKAESSSSEEDSETDYSDSD